jgi:hypothetical protein
MIGSGINRELNCDTLGCEIDKEKVLTQFASLTIGMVVALDSNLSKSCEYDTRIAEK